MLLISVNKLLILKYGPLLSWTPCNTYPVYNCRISYTACKAHSPLMFLFVGRLLLEYFSTLSDQQHHFQEKKGNWTFKANSHIACCAHAVPLPCHAVKYLECVFPTWFTLCGRVWFTLSMPCSDHAVLLKATVQHGQRETACGLTGFSFSRLPRGVPRRLFSEAYQSSSQRSIPKTVKSVISTLQKRRSVKLLD
jgi:hypothetical protein